MKDLQNSSSPEASKLTEFLARNEVEELLEAHDTIVRNFFPDTESDLTLKQEEPVYRNNISHDPNIKIIKIEKTNEPLVSTEPETREPTCANYEFVFTCRERPLGMTEML